MRNKLIISGILGLTVLSITFSGYYSFAEKTLLNFRNDLYETDYDAWYQAAIDEGLIVLVTGGDRAVGNYIPIDNVVTLPDGTVVAKGSTEANAYLASQSAALPTQEPAEQPAEEVDEEPAADTSKTETKKNTNKKAEEKEQEKKSEPAPTTKASYTVTYVTADETMGVVTNDTETLDEGLSFKGSTAIPNALYEFVNWTDENGKVVSTDLALIPGEASANHSYTANFKAIEYTITYESSNEELGTVSVASETASVLSPASGSEAVLNSGKEDAYYFRGWRKDFESVSSTETTIVPSDVDADVTYTAEFSPIEFTLSYSVSDEKGGVLSTDAAVYTVEALPDAVTFEVANGYEFTGWSKDGIIVSYDASFVPEVTSGNHSYVANVEKKADYTLYAIIGGAAVLLLGAVAAIFVKKRKG